MMGEDSIRYNLVNYEIGKTRESVNVLQHEYGFIKGIFKKGRLERSLVNLETGDFIQSTNIPNVSWWGCNKKIIFKEKGGMFV